MSKEEQIDLIAGRIIDEYRKHPLLEWNKIAASKIHSQWFEHYAEEIAKLKASKSEANEADLDLIWTDVCISIVNRENNRVPFVDTLKYLKSKFTITRNNK